MTSWASRWHLLTFVLATGAVLLQLGLVVSGSAILAETDPPSLGERVGRFFCYFTVQSNLLVAVATWPLVRDPSYDGSGWRVLRTASVVGITITGLVHYVLLRPLLDLDGLDRAADTLLHVVVPLATVAGWAAFGPRPRTGLREIRLVVLWPLAWLAFTLLLVRGTTGWVPYPFLDPAEQGGWGGVAVACLGVLVLFLLVSGAAYAVDRRAPARPRAGVRANA